jgi:hypothetical protein
MDQLRALPSATPTPETSPEPTSGPGKDMTPSLMNPNLPENQEPQAPQPPPTPPAPTATTAQPNPMADFTTHQMGDYQKLYNQIGQGIQGEANAESAGAKAQAAAQEQAAAAYQKQIDSFNQQKAQLDTEHAQLQENVAKDKINPEQWWSKHVDGSAPRKVLAMIGMFLGGVGQNKTGQNPFFQVVQKFMDDDMKSQEENLETQKGLLSDNLKKYGNLDAARQATRMDYMSMLQAQIAKISAQTQSGVAKAKAQQALGQLGIQMEGMKTQLAQHLATQQFFAGDSGMAAYVPKEIKEVAVEHPDSGKFLQGKSPDAAKTANEVVAKYRQLQGVLRDAQGYMGVDQDWNPVAGSDAGPREFTRIFYGIKTPQEETATQLKGFIEQGIRQMVESSGGAIRVGNNPEGFIHNLVPDMTRWQQDPVREEMRKLDAWLKDQRDAVLTTNTFGYKPSPRIKPKTTTKAGW